MRKSIESRPRMPVFQPPTYQPPSPTPTRSPDKWDLLDVIPDYTEFPVLGDDFVQMTLAKSELDEHFSQLKKELDELDAKRRSLNREISDKLLAADRNSVMLGQLKVMRIESCTASKLSPQRLLDAGVSADTIRDCTEPGSPYSYIKIVSPKT